MQPDEIRFLFAYDKWATRRLFAVMDGLDPEVWARSNVVDERGLGGILIHQLGATMRWRHGLRSLEGERPRPESGPLPTPSDLRELFEAEWAAYEDWGAALTSEMLANMKMAYPSGRCSSTW